MSLTMCPQILLWHQVFNKLKEKGSKFCFGQMLFYVILL